MIAICNDVGLRQGIVENMVQDMLSQRPILVVQPLPFSHFIFTIEHTSSDRVLLVDKPLGGPLTTEPAIVVFMRAFGGMLSEPSFPCGICRSEHGRVDVG